MIGAMSSTSVSLPPSVGGSGVGMIDGGDLGATGGEQASGCSANVRPLPLIVFKFLYLFGAVQCKHTLSVSKVCAAFSSCSFVWVQNSPLLQCEGDTAGGGRWTSPKVW